MAIFYRFLVKRDTASNFTAANTLLLEGEFGLELDTGQMKMGDGVTAWTSLPYLTTDNWPEGSNLYHTAARVRATVLTGLSTATSAVITAADTVLSAIGKLQAQITALVSTVSSGTYTPVLTGVTNIASSTPSLAQWMRVGSVVTVSGRLDFTPTAAGVASQIDISLPIASNLTAIGSLGGSIGIFAIGAVTPAAFFAETTNDRARCLFTAASATGHAGGFSFTYRIS